MTSVCVGGGEGAAEDLATRNLRVGTAVGGFLIAGELAKDAAAGDEVCGGEASSPRLLGT